MDDMMMPAHIDHMMALFLPLVPTGKIPLWQMKPAMWFV